MSDNKTIVIEFEGRKYTHFKGKFTVFLDNYKGIYPTPVIKNTGIFQLEDDQVIFEGDFDIEVIENNEFDLWIITVESHRK